MFNLLSSFWRGSRPPTEIEEINEQVIVSTSAESRTSEEAATIITSSNQLAPAEDNIDNSTSNVKITPDKFFKEVNTNDGDMKCKIPDVMVMIMFFVFFCIFCCLIASLLVAKLKKMLIWDLPVWKWCVFVMVIFSGILVASMAKEYWTNTKMLFFMYSLRKSGVLFAWILSVFLVWVCLINPGLKRSKSTSVILNRVTWTLISLVFWSFLLMLKTLSLEILLSKFQINAYLDRIQESLFVQFTLYLLTMPPFQLDQGPPGTVAWIGEITRMAERDNDRLRIGVRKLFQLRLGTISAWKVTKLVNIATDPTLYIYGNTRTGPVVAIKSEEEAKAAANRIFTNVARSSSTHIEEQDLLTFMKIEELDILRLQIAGFLETRRITGSALEDWLINVLRETKALAYALSDTKTVIRQLSNLLSGIAAMVTVIIWLIALKITSPATIAIFVTAVAFTFGNTSKNVFEAVVFVFLVHPFDVGDLCVVDETTMLVEKMGILSTVFLKRDNNEKIYYPNSVLATKPVSNYNRSPDMIESVQFTIDFTTPDEKIKALEAKVKKYLESKPLEWNPKCCVEVVEIENENKMKLALYCKHKMNFQDYNERNMRRTKLVFAMKTMFEELDLQYNLIRSGSLGWFKQVIKDILAL